MGNNLKWNDEPQMSEDVRKSWVDWLLYDYHYFCCDCGIKCDLVENTQTLVSGQSVFELWFYRLLAGQAVT